MSAASISEKNKQEEPKKQIRKGPKVVGTLILVVLIIAGLWFGFVRGVDTLKYVGTDDAIIDGNQINLSSRIPGRISSINTEEGQIVESGAVLVQLDAADLHAQEVQAQASLAYARQNLVLGKIKLDKTRNDYNRIQNLYNNNAATRESYEHAQSALNTAQAQYNLTQAQINTSAAQLGVIETQLLNTSIKTPISGTIDKINLTKGDVVQPGQTILSISNLNDIWITANLEETKINRVREGARVKITIDAMGSRKFEGTVELIHAGIVPPAFQLGEFTKTTQRIPVKIRINNIGPGTDFEGLKLLPGMSAEVKIRTPNPLPRFLDK